METSIEKDFEEVINALLCGIETEREEFIDSNQDLIQRLEKIKSNKSNYGFIEYLDLFILSKIDNLICSTIKVPTSNENTYIIKNIINGNYQHIYSRGNYNRSSFCNDYYPNNWNYI